MKNNKAYTLFEVLILISIIGLLSAIFLPIVIKNLHDHNPKSNITYNVGDLVYIDGFDVTGKVVNVIFDGYVQIMIKNTNGIPIIMEPLPPSILTKIIHPEK